MANDDHWLDKRKSKDSIISRRMDSVRNNRLAATQQSQGDWTSGVEGFSPRKKGNESSASAFSTQSGQYGALESQTSIQPLSPSYDPGHFAKPAQEYFAKPSQEHFAKPDPSVGYGYGAQEQADFVPPRHYAVPEQPGYRSEQNIAAVPLYQDSMETLASQTDLNTVQPAPPTVQDVIAMSDQEIDARAFFDPQTQAYNFRYIVRRMEHELSRAKYFGRTVAILVISIDTIKVIPTESGQSPIDKALDIVAQSLFNNVRPIDLIGRYTEDRFVVVCPEVSVEQVSELAENIRQACANHVVKHQWQNFKLSVSIGIAISSPEFEDVESLIAIADVGADMITQGGGNGICFGTDTL